MIRAFMICLGLVISSYAGLSKQAQAKEAVRQEPQGTPYSQKRLNWLVERDRPKDLIVGGPFDLKLYKKYHKEIERQNELGRQAVAEYRKTRSPKSWRAMLDAVNRGAAIRRDELVGGGILRSVFHAMHEMGPPINDPDDGGNAEFAAKRHHAMMRLLARYL